VTGEKVLKQNKLLKKISGGMNKNVAVFAFFLFLSSLFWYLNALGKEVEAEIRYPVNYINLPKNSVIVEEQQANLNLLLKGPGYSVLKLKLTSKKTPVIIDVSEISYRRVPGSNGLDYFILTSGITKNLELMLKTECVITSVKPDTLFFTLNEIASESASVNHDH
jgi:hypothetical protein